MEFSLWHLFSEASWLVKGVILALCFLSISSWTCMFKKGLQLSNEYQLNQRFEAEFWKGADLSALYQRLNQHAERGACVLERAFEATFKEFLKQKQLINKDVSMAQGSLERAMRASVQRDMDQMESGLSFIATVGSISPYIGLLGTVWGIMNAFQGLSLSGQATLSQVAPGIAEALVTTAIGLFTAIPAVIAYNRFTRQLEKISGQGDIFSDELSNILLRQM